MANINKIRLSGTTYNIQDPNAQPLLTAGQGITIENNVISATGGGSVSSAITSGDTNAVAGGAVYDKFDEVEQVTAAGLNALNDKINPTVELTQEQYEALVSGGTVNPNTYYIITDAQPVDISNYWTSAQTNSAINAAVANKVDKSAVTSSVTSASTDTEIPTAKAVYDAVGQGGGGKAVSGGTNISITTGETADTINCTLPISTDGNYAGKGIILGNGNNMRSRGASSIVGGDFVSASTNAHYSVGFGRNINLSNEAEFGSGKYSVTNSASSTFGDSGNTLFSVGNGTSTSARHNAFEIRQNGDIYLTLDGQDVKLQDQLGGSSITVDTALDSGSTNPVENRVIYNKFDEVEQVTAAGLNAVNGKFGGLKLEQISQSAYNSLTTKDSSTLYIIVN